MTNKRNRRTRRRLKRNMNADSPISRDEQADSVMRMLPAVRDKSRGRRTSG